VVEIMCGGYTGEHEVKSAEIKAIPYNGNGSAGPDVKYKVKLFKDKEYFGLVDTSTKSYHYAKDVVENWETGILGEDNEHIIKPN
jgi:hypothetical protein